MSSMNDFEIQNGVLKKYNGIGGDVVIPEGVKSIGDHAFYGCTELMSVTFSDSITSIGYRAFHGCNGITNITIPEGVENIRSYAFWGCTNLTSITIRGKATSIGDRAFYGCWGLADKDGFVIIRNVLYEYCGNEKNVEVPNCVTSIGSGVFWYRSGLTNVTIPESVTSIGDGAFYGCRGLADKDGFVIIRNVLYEYCGNEENVEIPHYITSIGYRAFYHCVDLKSVTIPESVTSIGEAVFSDCRNLTSITIPDGVTSIRDHTFSGCTSLKSVTIPESVTSIESGAFSDCRGLTSVTIPESVTSIASTAFENCSGLVDIHFKGGLTNKTTLYELIDYCAIHAPQIPPSEFSLENRKRAAAGFAEMYYEGEEMNGEIASQYRDYISKQKKRLLPLAKKHMPLLLYMLQECKFKIEDIDAMIADEEYSTEAKAMLLEYRDKKFSKKQKENKLNREFESL